MYGSKTESVLGVLGGTNLTAKVTTGRTMSDAHGHLGLVSTGHFDYRLEWSRSPKTHP